MKKISNIALLASGAAVVASMPRAIHAMPRADAGDDPKAMIAQIQAAWNEHKTTIEANLGAKADDSVVTTKLAAINADLDKLVKAFDAQKEELAAARLGGGGTGALSPEAKAHVSAFDSWFRKGNEPASMRELEVKAKLTTQSDPDGGYLVPTEMDKEITRVLGTVSAVRSIARVISVSTNEYQALVSQGGAAGGWVGEKDARPETSTPTLAKIILNMGEIYAEPGATQTLLDDSFTDIASWLADEVSITFAEKEGAAFISGDGKAKPRGFMSYTNVANASYQWGKIGFIATGSASGFITPTSSASPADCLAELYYALKSGYRNGAAFITSDAVLGTIRKFKDGQGNFLWSPPTTDMPATILGKPIYTDDNMQALGSGNFPVAFGNFKRGYTIADRMGVRVLRDPFTSKPNVLFYTTKRVGGGVTNFEAIKLLKCA